MEGDERQIASIAEDSGNSRCPCVLWRFSSEVVGATGFEPATPCAQGRCATRLRYGPTHERPLSHASIARPDRSTRRTATPSLSPASCVIPRTDAVNLQMLPSDGTPLFDLTGFPVDP